MVWNWSNIKSLTLKGITNSLHYKGFLHNTIELTEAFSTSIFKFVMKITFARHKELNRPITMADFRRYRGSTGPKMPPPECDDKKFRPEVSYKKTAWYPDAEFYKQYSGVVMYPKGDDVYNKPYYKAIVSPAEDRKWFSRYLNYGPVHPSAHGCLRLVLELDAETIISVTPHIGLLHRGSEKLMEYKTYIQALPYFDRMDYVSVMCCELAYCLAVEKLLGLEVPKRAKFIRTMFCELMRIMNHTCILGGHILDCGAITPLFWMFEEREKGYEFCERVSGSRMHSCYFRVGGVAYDLPLGFLHDIYDYAWKFCATIDEVEDVVTDNRIFRMRNIGVGVITAEQAKNWCCSGSTLRASGIKWDLRKMQPYDAYSALTFDVPLGNNGDCFDRYLIRVKEMRESARMIMQCVNMMPEGEIQVDDHKVTPPKRIAMKSGMEDLIHHFKYFTEGFSVPPGATYTAVEAPKGEFGVYLVSDGTSRPYRVRVRSPSFAHLSMIDMISRQHMIADITTILGALDVVFGEVDR